MNRRTYLNSLAGLVLGSPTVAWAACRTGRLAGGKIRVDQQGRGFRAENGEPFVPYGVNYFRPGTGWAPQLWKRFDRDATRADFARLRSLGANTVRVFLSFGSFAPEPGVLDPEGLERFDELLELAGAEGLYVHPTGLDHWEGRPQWARGDRYADEPLLAAQDAFWTEFAARYRGHPGLFAYDLLNEPAIGWDTPALLARWGEALHEKYGVVAALADAWGVSAEGLSFEGQTAPDPVDAPGDCRLLDFQDFREEIATSWVKRQAAAIRGADPDALVTVGLVQWSVPVSLPGSVRHYAAFRPSRIAPHLDFLEVHFYPLADGAYTYDGPESEGRNMAYVEALVREVAAPGKPVVLAEFGWYGGITPTFQTDLPAASQEDQARYCRRVVETTTGYCQGWLNWGLYDHPEAGDCTQGTGLLTADGTTKAWGRTFAELAETLTERAAAPVPARDRPELDYDACRRSMEAIRGFQERYHAAYRSDRPDP